MPIKLLSLDSIALRSLRPSLRLTCGRVWCSVVPLGSSVGEVRQVPGDCGLRAPLSGAAVRQQQQARHPTAQCWGEVELALPATFYLSPGQGGSGGRLTASVLLQGGVAAGGQPANTHRAPTHKCMIMNNV